MPFDKYRLQSVKDQIEDLQDEIAPVQVAWNIDKMLIVLTPLLTALAIIAAGVLGSDTWASVFGALAGFTGVGAVGVGMFVMTASFHRSSDGLFQAKRTLRRLERERTRLILAREGIDTTI